MSNTFIKWFGVEDKCIMILILKNAANKSMSKNKWSMQNILLIYPLLKQQCV